MRKHEEFVFSNLRRNIESSFFHGLLLNLLCACATDRFNILINDDQFHEIIQLLVRKWENLKKIDS